MKPYVSWDCLIDSLDNWRHTTGIQNELIIASPTSWKVLVDVYPTFMTKIDIANLLFTDDFDEYCTDEVEFDAVIGIGGGRAIELAKSTASQAGVSFIAVPTMLTTCAFATSRAEILSNIEDVMYYEYCEMPDEVWIDEWVLDENPRMNIVGLMSIASILFAMREEMTQPNPSIRVAPTPFKKDHFWQRGSALLREADALIENYLLNEVIPSNKSVFKLLKEMGELTELYHSNDDEYNARTWSTMERVANLTSSWFLENYNKTITKAHSLVVGYVVQSLFIEQETYPEHHNCEKIFKYTLPMVTKILGNKEFVEELTTYLGNIVNFDTPHTLLANQKARNLLAEGNLHNEIQDYMDKTLPSIPQKTLLLNSQKD